MASLQPGRFHYLLVKNALRTFTMLLSRVQKYSNIDDLIDVKRSTGLDSQKSGVKRKKKKELIENKKRTSRPLNNMGQRILQSNTLNTDYSMC